MTRDGEVVIDTDGRAYDDDAVAVIPPAITCTRRGGGRSYFIDGAPVPGVTTILDGGWPKPALKQWAADEVARAALERRDEWAAMSHIEAWKKLRMSYYGPRDEAARAGTQVHELAEALAAGAEVEVPPALVGHVDAALAFMSEAEVAILHTEAIVASVTHRYAGRLDLIADTRHGRALLDWKTNRSGVFPESALQLAAYRFAEWIVGTAGTAEPMPAVDLAAVVWLRADGTYQLVPVTADEATHRTFLYVAQVAAATSAGRDAFIGDPIA